MTDWTAYDVDGAPVPCQSRDVPLEQVREDECHLQTEADARGPLYCGAPIVHADEVCDWHSIALSVTTE